MIILRSAKLYAAAAYLIVAMLLIFAASSRGATKAGMLLTSTVIEQTNYLGSYYGGVYYRDTEVNEYDKHGTLVRSLDTYYSVFSGQAQSGTALTIYTYNQRDELVLSVQDGMDADGTVNSRITTIYTNLPTGQSRQIELHDDNFDGKVDSLWTTTDTYVNDRIVRSVLDEDIDGDGVVDARSTAAWTYDLTNHRITAIFQFEPNADGVADDRLTETEIEITDDRGFPISGVAELADGTLRTSTFSYNKFGFTTQIKLESATDTTTFTMFWDHRGQAIRSAPHPNSPEGVRASHGRAFTERLLQRMSGATPKPAFH